MVASLIFLAATQLQKTLLGQVAPNPTGRNGYEDYLRAADLTRTLKVGLYERWIAAIANGDTASVPKEDIPMRVTPEMSILDVRKRMDESAGPIVAAIKAGNAKEVYDPRVKFEPTTLFPEFAQFKVAARTLANRAHVEFAVGRSNAATATLLDDLTFAWNLQGSSLIASLVSIACSSIALAEFEEHLGQLTPSDASAIERFCNELVSRPVPIEATMRVEREFGAAGLELVAKGEDLASLLGAREDAYRLSQFAAIKNLGRSELKQVIEGALEIVGQRYATMVARLSGPESSWFEKNPPSKPANPRDLSIENLRRLLADFFCDEDPYPQYEIALAKARTQLRLLRVHAQIIRYRWLTGTLPTNLDQCCPKESSVDPFTRKPLHFEPIEGGYRLYSLGIPDVGKVELKYKSNGAGAKGAEPPTGDPR